ncbi:RdgB/HAM1 family non-canonical purine NTP pyrophosphatase [Fructobacillus parabroussonetiae]|uniref:dITP/XTP pyrophosphatase n=1 Tax=Fructobacillus parabroussonetiae TaxID=2713174 RepID=A0ABS5R0G6_9LACO|nr:RdgB/HAM1 family non-canonical purine NTP pyrophosphatase [Fructobacillus parabroussonetiae]MBS9337647.1 RdgB/HAM1 family non-canonical purine NTP pyrophosphatase [Fructobacillus parabroussonetiae]
MTRLIIASKNAHKVNEMKAAFKEAAIALDLVSLADLPAVPDVLEDGQTFLENATKKAETIAKAYPDDLVLADDSGLTIPSLNGEPGVFSARYAGDHDDVANNRKVLAKLSGKQDIEREAFFTTVMVVVGPDRANLQVAGRVDGFITEDWDGQESFGYDPIFYYAPAEKTFAEMTTAEKNDVSHRGRALQELRLKLPAWLAE